jgi:hypothetical protein
MRNKQSLHFVHWARSFVHDIEYFEYFGGVILLAALGKFEFVFTDSDILTQPEFVYRSLYFTMSVMNLGTYCEYIRIAYV